jgi:hypothetical protein
MRIRIGIQITDSSSKYTWHKKPTAKVVALFQGRGLTTAGFTEEVIYICNIYKYMFIYFVYIYI